MSDELRVRLPSPGLPPWNAEVTIGEYLDAVEAHLVAALQKPPPVAFERPPGSAPAVRAFCTSLPLNYELHGW